jgi:hypothetical protein
LTLLAADHPEVRVVGAEVAASPGDLRHRPPGRVVDVDVPPTFVDGLVTNLEQAASPLLVAGFALSLDGVDAYRPGWIPTTSRCRAALSVTELEECCLLILSLLRIHYLRVVIALANNAPATTTANPNPTSNAPTAIVNSGVCWADGSMATSVGVAGVQRSAYGPELDAWAARVSPYEDG